VLVFVLHNLQSIKLNQSMMISRLHDKLISRYIYNHPSPAFA